MRKRRGVENEEEEGAGGEWGMSVRKEVSGGGEEWQMNAEREGEKGEIRRGVGGEG